MRDSPTVADPQTSALPERPFGPLCWISSEAVAGIERDQANPVPYGGYCAVVWSREQSEAPLGGDLARYFTMAPDRRFTIPLFAAQASGPAVAELRRAVRLLANQVGLEEARRLQLLVDAAVLQAWTDGRASAPVPSVRSLEELGSQKWWTYDRPVFHERDVQTFLRPLGISIP